MKKTWPEKSFAEPASFMGQVATADLSVSERKLVEYLLSIPEFVLATATSNQLAEQTRTSRSTVDRLARKFGYGGHKEMRRALLQESRAMKAQVGASPVQEPAISEDDHPYEIAFKVFNNASVRALKFAELLFSSSELERLIEALLTSQNIKIFGAGSSAVVGLDMQQRLLRLGLPITFSEDAHTQIAFAALMGSGDLAICISYSGRTKLTVRAAEIASRQGATLAGILGAAESPLSQLCDIRILTPPGVGLFGTDAVMTRILQMMFNEVLFHCLALRSKKLLANAEKIDLVLNDEKVHSNYKPKD
jgi:DNA-binding MurR/RpiR family transcriptional regulator